MRLSRLGVARVSSRPAEAQLARDKARVESPRYRRDVRDRIAFLVRQEEGVLAEKRKRIEQTLWAIHEADIGDLWETYETTKVDQDGKAETDEAGNMLKVKKERPRLLSDLPPDIARLVEDVTIDSKGRLIPKLYSKLQASKELRRCSISADRRSALQTCPGCPMRNWWRS